MAFITESSLCALLLSFGGRCLVHQVVTIKCHESNNWTLLSYSKCEVLVLAPMWSKCEVLVLAPMWMRLVLPGCDAILLSVWFLIILGQHSWSHFWGSCSCYDWMTLEGETTTPCRQTGNQIPSDTASHTHTHTQCDTEGKKKGCLLVRSHAWHWHTMI
jgi:hypothetical protein